MRCHNTSSLAGPDTARTIEETDVSATITVLNKLTDRLKSAAARGSDTSSRADAIADEFPHNATPWVTQSSSSLSQRRNQGIKWTLRTFGYLQPLQHQRSNQDSQDITYDVQGRHETEVLS
ncbi:hypothetical protein MMC06_006109 [Schaereria dolodes]|nr:hypothetical protein [Schaereria dolodes]